MVISKQCIGIDISHKSFTACICKQSGSEQAFSEVRNFKNEKTGFNQLIRWVTKTCDKEVETVYLMEATGVYYERLAYHLNMINKVVHIVLPNTSKHYFSSLNIKTKTDEVDARILSRFGVERQHRQWQPPSPVLLELRNLTRFYVQLQEQKTALNNIKHSKEAAYEVQKFILQSNKTLIRQIDNQITKCRDQVGMLIAKDPELKKQVDNLLTIKGVGLITVATILSETSGFQYVKNIKQLVSYAGYDVVQRESGTSIKGKTRISKKGNRYIRNALYFPAMVACRFNPKFKAAYIRIIKRKPSKMIGQVAIQRKLLVLIYTLWKTGQPFNENHNESSPIQLNEATQDNIPEMLPQ